MVLERCPLCQSQFVVPAAIEGLLHCPRCAVSLLPTGAPAVTVLQRQGDEHAVPVAELALPPDFTAQYQTERLLGAGSFGTVYLAREVATGTRVAVKFLKDRGNSTGRLRFQREIALQSRLMHPNVVAVRGAGELGEHAYLVCEYLDGGTLAGRIKAHGRLPPTESVRVMRDVLAGLGACHAMGILHRDLKPDNVLFTRMGRAKVADLGLAKDRAGEMPHLTGSNVMFGTPIYMSPEQIRGQALTPEADLYSAGIVLYEMLVGEPPFTAENAWDLFERHVHAPPPSLLDAVPYAATELAEAVNRALEKDPASRFGSAAAFAAALECCR